MNAFIRVDRNPFHAVTDAQGGYRIAKVPPGQHTVEVWHEHFGALRIRISIEAGMTTTHEFTYTGSE